ncbi:hypothetical protein ES319_D10G263800v1 [Gossypium barbadense]|uniref:Uncharacterized protein n=1 Tax=Gossypium barbadense TaxID=3634 RepID=A0A5J5PXJ1_GOSBA|nr:hypothetical protein ES319_D10G263800v1 [Gossypium barbadense]
MAQLTQLRLLDLRGCRELKIIPPNVLSGLSKLEELYMSGSFVEWEKGGVVENERKNASLDELNNLRYLTTLYVRILDVQMIPKHQFVEKLDRFRIFVGNYGIYDCCHNYESPKALKLMLYTNIDLDNGMKMLLKKTEDLCLEGLEGVKNVLVELNNGKDLPNLKRLHVKNGRHVQHIKTNKIGFSELCFITLENLPQLVSFCSPDERCSTKPLLLSNKQTCHWVTNLRSLIIKGCGKLEHLLSPSLARSLVIPKLEELELQNFGDMDQFPPDLFQHIKVFALSGGSPFSLFPFVRRFYNMERLKFSFLDFKHVVPCKGDAGTLPPIRNLELFSARNLNHIWRKGSELYHILSNLQTLTVLRCDDWINIRAFSSSLQNLTILNVSLCKMTTNLVTPSVLKNLVQLTTIKVEDCTKMTEIVGNEGDCHQTIVVSKLKCLQLCNLKSHRVKIFCSQAFVHGITTSSFLVWKN